ncbi:MULTISPECIES: low molecular weight protein-tyrosine-phosphatase [unclassified Ensifer]|uniref:low molecular weight protein-tyrosine-phosphatase n=1 Tax=unclassified Ensifer TaxID=2633371 RepID=UPI00081395D1|nr:MULTISPECIES: low molecular weight protein-tyrosine-phosphatase [unclassified Ensifer]OCO99702.1 protein tyrosine phosphatase [Ensifer sp. LC14]OCP04804.1 protein tyrosine phosphatase [Ensifer sp. LC11]OCP12517.1 protein tyrosine phosphatase [Ensifer sp. LC13]OCP32961.1 protein tyrosine phosphatase [Ensifer sp. LC499]
MKPVRVLFVCLGNICRSPLAEGVLREAVNRKGLASALEVDSAGTGAWHIGDPPDRRSIEAARRHGIDISALRGRQVAAADFNDFDLILGMDDSNVRALKRLAPEGTAEKVHLFLDYASGREQDVPDPYYEGAEAFEALYQMLEAGCSSLLDRLGARTS